MAFRNALRSLGRFASVAPAPYLAEAALPAGKPYLQTALRGVGASAWCQVKPEAAEGGKSGWGQTTIKDVLDHKGIESARAAQKDAGSWLWVSMDDTVLNAVKKMTKAHVGSLLVFDPSKMELSEDDKPDMDKTKREAVVGIVTERDYLTKVVVVGKSSATLPVNEIMTPESKLMTVVPQQSVLDVMKLMMKYNFRHVPVVDGEKYMGMISIRDVVATMVDEHQEEVGRLHEYIQGSY